MSEHDSTANTFRTPNLYVDRLMAFLTPEEFVVLTYATRRIYGFQKLQDRISVSQFTDGTTAKDGTRLDHGTGLAGKTVRDILKRLDAFGVLIRMNENDPHRNEGAEYALQTDANRIDWVSLTSRRAETEQAAAARTQAARTRKGKTSVCPTYRPPVAEVYPSHIQTPLDVPHIDGLVVGQPPQKTGERKGKTDGASARPVAADPLLSGFVNPRPEVQEAVFDYCGRDDRKDFEKVMERTCQQWEARGEEMDLAILKASAERGKKLWKAEGKTGPVKLINCMQDALSLEVDARRVLREEQARQERHAEENRRRIAADAEKVKDDYTPEERAYIAAAVKLQVRTGGARLCPPGMTPPTPRVDPNLNRQLYGA